MWVINIKAVLISTLLVLSLGCQANPVLKQNAEPRPVEGGGMLIPKTGNTVFTMCGLPMLLIMHNEDGIEVYGGPNIATRAMSIPSNVPLTVAEMSSAWPDKIECPKPSSDTKGHEKKKPREWYAGF